MRQVFFGCIRLHSYEPKDRKGYWKSLSEGHEQTNIQDVQNVYCDFIPAQPEELVCYNAVDRTPRATRKHTKRFLRNDVVEEYMTVVLEALQKRSRTVQVSVPMSTGRIKANTLKLRKVEKHRAEDNPRYVETVDDKQATVLPSAFKRKAQIK